MNLSELMLDADPIRQYTIKGELLPDPNLIKNIDHLEAFIDMELESWLVHSNKVNKELDAIPVPNAAIVLFEDKNVLRYLKSLFDVATYYITCTDATDKLMSQLYKVSTEYYGLRVKKPKLKVDKQFHEKIRHIRNKSFAHQDSEQMENLMDKRTAMSWWPSVSSKIGITPSCEDYMFGGGKWFVEVNGIRTETEIDCTIKGFLSVANTAKEQILIRKQRVLAFYHDIKHNKSIQPTDLTPL